MEMKRCTGCILLMLSLLVVAGAVADDDTDIIRLPTGINRPMLQRYVSAAVAAAGHGKLQKPPYDCCNQEICDRLLIPPKCTCWDEVKSCSSTCQVCDKLSKNTYVCLDWYGYGWNEPRVPRCSDKAN